MSDDADAVVNLTVNLLTISLSDKQNAIQYLRIMTGIAILYADTNWWKLLKYLGD